MACENQVVQISLPYHIDTEAFASIPLKQNSSWLLRHCLCLFADPPSAVAFMGW
jgi:hypothetical protein